MKGCASHLRQYSEAESKRALAWLVEGGSEGMTRYLCRECSYWHIQYSEEAWSPSEEDTWKNE